MTTKTFKVLLLAIVASKAAAQDVYAPTNFESYIKEAIWQVNIRGGFNAAYKGTTGLVCEDGQIIVHKPDYAEWLQDGRTAAYPGAFASMCKDTNNAFALVFNPTYTMFGLDQGLINHELTHAMGHWGHTPGGLMDAQAVNSQFVSQKEQEFLLNAHWWPQVNPPDWCSVLVTRTNRMFIPEIMGYSAELAYDFSRADGHYWKLATLKPNIPTMSHPCQNVLTEEGHIVLPSVLTQDAGYEAVLDPAYGEWKLIDVKRTK